MNSHYVLSHEIPTVTVYCRLRRQAGLSPRSAKAAEAGLPNGVASVLVRRGEEVVAMGRAIGDGLHYQITDMAVMPDHQGRGIGKAIMAALMARLREIAPAEAYVSLIADGEAWKLYGQFGFAPVAPASIGMAAWLNRPDE